MNIDAAPETRTLLPALSDLPGHLVWRARARVVAALEEVLPEAVDIHAYAVLLALAGGASRSQRALADMVAVSGTTMMRVAADLATQGLVERVRNPDDRRSYALTRTAEGAAAARSWRRYAEDVEDSITAGFTVGEREDLRSLLLRVVEPDLSADTPEPLRESIAFLVTRLQFRMHRDFQVALAPIGIEPPHFGILVALEETGPISQSALARHFAVSGAHMVQLDRRAGGPVAGGTPAARDRPPRARDRGAPRSRARPGGRRRRSRRRPWRSGSHPSARPSRGG